MRDKVNEGIFTNYEEVMKQKIIEKKPLEQPNKAVAEIQALEDQHIFEMLEQIVSKVEKLNFGTFVTSNFDVVPYIEHIKCKLCERYHS